MTDDEKARAKYEKKLARMRERYHQKKSDKQWFERERIRKRVQKRISRLRDLSKARAEERVKYRKRTITYKADPTKNNARLSLNYSVRHGLIKKPKKCSVCKNALGRIEAHHKDYSKPLEVVWLCSVCHGKKHRMPN